MASGSATAVKTRSNAHLSVQKQQVERENHDVDLHFLLLHFLPRARAQNLERQDALRLAVPRHALAIHDERSHRRRHAILQRLHQIWVLARVILVVPTEDLDRTVFSPMDLLHNRGNPLPARARRRI